MSSEVYQRWLYPEHSFSSITERRLITRIPLDAGREALLGLLFQHFFLSPHLSIYWGFVAQFDFRQSAIYFYQDNITAYNPLDAQSVIDMVAESMARVGFLDCNTASTPGGVQAWIDSVVTQMTCPAPPKLGFKHLSFFQYSPLMGRWVTQPILHYNPVLHEDFYTDLLDQDDDSSEYSYDPVDPDIDNYFGWDEVALSNMWD
ncbi:hypothetical protein PQX77_022028 [Marasmius sp. AFHP31]|nr:hypothetical protein PQX77_022028 [Marasmius sp. AFHP31]